MRLFRYTRGEERHFLGSSFEPHGDGFVFYRHHWAPGVPVSAEEKEEYLRPPLDGSRNAFYGRIRGRAPVVPRRPWLRSHAATLTGIPAAFGFGLVLLGAWMTWRGLGFAEPAPRWLLLVAGAMGVAYGAQVLAVRLWR